MPAPPSPKPWPAHHPGALIEEQYRRTRIIRQHGARPSRQPRPVQVDGVCVIVGASRGSVTVEASGRRDRVIPHAGRVRRSRQE